ncbi:MAG: DUF1844 domain-containing protein [Planctomycetota bacterium]
MAEENNPFEDDDETSTENRRTAADMALPGGDFRMFTSKLAFQALMGLGLIENPISKSTELHIDHARMVIDDLRMLREKTKGNLAKEEDAHLNKIISDLQHHFVRVVNENGGEE